MPNSIAREITFEADSEASPIPLELDLELGEPARPAVPLEELAVPARDAPRRAGVAQHLHRHKLLRAVPGARQ